MWQVIWRGILNLSVVIGLAIIGQGCAHNARYNDAWFAKDKAAHFVGSAVISGIATKVAMDRGSTDCDAALAGMTVSIAIGSGKEIYDKRIKKTFYSSKDIVWNVLGSLAGSLAVSRC